jgi:ribosomal protein S18 acetylase RimI-like enzyme
MRTELPALIWKGAEHHASLDPERYLLPPVETILARYRERAAGGGGITLVAVLGEEIVGFVDAGLDRSHDLMHREIVYCHIAEIAVSSRRRSLGIGGRLLQAAEEWGRGRGAEFASLEYHTANIRAGLFYRQRMGYRPASITAIKRL